MEEANRLTVRDRRPDAPLAVIPTPSATGTAWDQLPRQPHLLDYLIILRKHQWLIVTFLLTVVTIVTVASLKMKPVFKAAARVEVDKESQNTLPFQQADPYEELEDTDELPLRLRCISCRARRWRYRPFAPWISGDIPNLAVNQQAKSARQGQSSVRRFWVHSLGSLTVKRVPDTRLIEVQFDAG